MEGEDGSLSIEPILYNRPERYFVDNNRMFKVGGTIYKVFEDGLVSTPLENQDLLREINNLEGLDPLKFKSTKDSKSNRELDALYNCGSYKTKNSDNNRDRTTITVETFDYHQFTNGIPAGTYVLTYGIIRPYLRTLGFYYHATRTITGKFNIATDFRDINGIWQRKIYKVNVNSGSPVYKVEHIGNDWISFGIHISSSSHFGALDCWGDTPSTSAAIIDPCNVFLLN